ncbi:hypothetical protein [Streptomyces sp. NPDC057909]|uniref:hypothetical protein n=1 Tax=Streptomyces sp. NPDC057909 TaxID=3346277 RepID=UPI0036E92F77
MARTPGFPAFGDHSAIVVALPPGIGGMLARRQLALLKREADRGSVTAQAS